MIDLFLKSKKVTLRQMQSLCGILNFSCSIIIPARAFSRRIYNLVQGYSDPFYKITITKQVKLDLLIWRHFLLGYNSRTFSLDFRWISSPNQICLQMQPPQWGLGLYMGQMVPGALVTLLLGVKHIFVRVVPNMLGSVLVGTIPSK